MLSMTDLAVTPAEALAYTTAAGLGVTLTPADLAAYHATRGRRGNHLPRGFQRVDRVEIPT